MWHACKGRMGEAVEAAVEAGGATGGAWLARRRGCGTGRCCLSRSFTGGWLRQIGWGGSDFPRCSPR